MIEPRRIITPAVIEGDTQRERVAVRVVVAAEVKAVIETTNAPRSTAGRHQGTQGSHRSIVLI